MIESSNVPGNPLRSYRMSMLAHGFLPTGASDESEWMLDETDPMSYAVVATRRPAVAVAVVIAVVMVVAVTVAALFG
jgi:hypothetical protein